MAISSAQYSITTTPTQIYLGDGATEVHIHIATGTAYLGDSTVTTSNGFKIDNGDKLTISTHETSLWAVATGTTATIYTLVLTR